MKNIMAKRVAKIIEGGTKIIGFTYRNKPRNVIIGTKTCSDFIPNWGIKENSSILKYNGKRFLVGCENNLPEGRRVKIFAVNKIRNASFIK